MPDKPTYAELEQRILELGRAETESKQAEEALRESEEKYRNLFTQIADPVFIFAKETLNFLDCNQSALNSYGYTLKELRKMTPGQLHPPEDLMDVDKNINDEHNNNPNHYTHITKSGEALYVEIHTTSIEYDGQDAWLSTVRDITERKQEEEKLLDQEKVLADILEDTLSGYWDWDLVNNTEYLSPAFKLMFGYQDHELENLPETWQKMIFPEDMPITLENFDMHVKTRGLHPFRQEVRYRHRDGSTVWVICTGRVVEWQEDGSPVRMVGCHVDITERKQAEDALRASEEKFKNAFQYSAIGMALISTEGKWLRVNSRICDILGYSEDELLQKTFQEITHPDDLNADLEYVAQMIAGEIKFYTMEKRYFHKKGNIICVLLAVSLVKDSLGKPAYFISQIEDITKAKNAETQRQELEAQLRQSQKLEAIGTMVGGISHEFNNVLQSMFLYASLVQADLPENEVLHSNFQRILDGGNRARDLIKQVLTFSRKAKVKMEPQHIHDMIMDVLVLERASLPANIDIQQDIDLNCGLVLCDKTQIHQIMVNLCNNAQHAMGEKGGTLTVSLKLAQASLSNGDPETDVLELKVSDTGHGIDASDLERIFDPFFTTKQFGQGTGLGLAVVHGIVEMMDGNISVTSEIDKGTTFRILFPVTEAVQEEGVIKSSVAADVMSRSILLVDDEESIRSVTQIILTRKGFKVDSASDGTQALELFKANPGKYDLIVTDQSMPRMSGIDLTKAIRKDNSDIPIILSTGQLGAENKKILVV